MEHILIAENLHYTYEDGTKALRGIDLKIRFREKVAVMGANGSGKSTFFLHLNGLLKPQSGRILIDEEPISYSRKDLLQVRKKVGIVFQNPDDQLFSASVKQEISFGVLNLGLSEEEAAQKVQKVMDELNITPFAGKPTHFLSGGQKKRVAIADILAMDPSLMILDEPWAALDPKYSAVIDGIIDKLTDKGITVLLSTHDAERALAWADRVILFDRGTVIGQGEPEEIFANQELLERANLQIPAVLRIFRILCSEGVLESSLKPPRSMKELEQYLRERKKG